MHDSQTKELMHWVLMSILLVLLSWSSPKLRQLGSATTAVNLEGQQTSPKELKWTTKETIPCRIISCYRHNSPQWSIGRKLPPRFFYWNHQDLVARSVTMEVVLSLPPLPISRSPSSTPKPSRCLPGAPSFALGAWPGVGGTNCRWLWRFFGVDFPSFEKCLRSTHSSNMPRVQRNSFEIHAAKPMTMANSTYYTEKQHNREKNII